MTSTEILEAILQKAMLNSNGTFPSIIISNIDVIINDIDKNKSIVSALITSLLKKTEKPEQDIRLHRVEFKGGYSARNLDTQVTTPFLKKHFPKYANKESGFLSMATRAQIPWTKKEGVKIPTRASRQFVASFLEILDAVQKQKVSPEDTLHYLFVKLIEITHKQKLIFGSTIESTKYLGVLNISIILQMLEKHFAIGLRGVSRLPVIAMYSIYTLLVKRTETYKNKVLKPLQVHTSLDKHGYGDIEIWNKDNTPFEMVEIKHNKAIDKNMVFDVVKKTEGTSVKRYFILTTAKNNFINSEEERFIEQFIFTIKKERKLDIIANGIFTSLKYYLRFIDDYHDFIETYTRLIVEDAQNSTEIKEYHIEKWKQILEEYQI